jgi:hypothetical protein
MRPFCSAGKIECDGWPTVKFVGDPFLSSQRSANRPGHCALFVNQDGPNIAARPRKTGTSRLPALGSGERQGLVAPAGRRTVNIDPLPGSLVTVTSPPIMRASLREMPAREKTIIPFV